MWWRGRFRPAAAVLLAILVVAAVASSVGAVSAQMDPEFRLSGPRALTDERYAGVAFNLHDAEYLVVWQDARNWDARSLDIFGQLVDVDGKRLGNNVRISGSAALGADQHPAVAYDAVDRRYLVVWQDGRYAKVRGPDIFGRLVDADGERVGSDFRISATAVPSYKSRAAVAARPDLGGFLVVWEDDRDWTTRGSDIYGQVVEADGTLVGSEFRITGSRARADAWDPAVAANTVRDEFLVVWMDQRNEATRGADIYAQRLDRDGTRLGTNFRISGKRATEWDQLAQVAFDPGNDRYLVAWSDFRNDSTRGSDVYGQLVDGDGARQGHNFRLSGSQATSGEVLGAVTHNEAGEEFLAVWVDFRNEASRGTEIYGQRVTLDGTRRGRNFRISGARAMADEQSPAAAHDPTTNRYLAVWHDERNKAARGWDVYGRFVAG